MVKKYDLSLFIFRRDLRLEDNTALLAAAHESKTILPCFIFDPRQVSDKNEYLSKNALEFMVTSLKELGGELSKRKGKLYLFYGIQEKIVENLLKKLPIDALYLNQDYTPFSIKRDEQLEKACLQHEIDYIAMHDVMLNPPKSVLTQARTPYSVFTAYFKKALKNEVASPQDAPRLSFYKKPVKESEDTSIYKKIAPENNPKIYRKGGRKEALAIFKNLTKFKNYKIDRDFPSKETTGLSAHIKFGTVSLREAYYAIVKKLGENHALIPQLYWHDFFTQIAYHSPFVYGHPFHEKYENLEWNKKQKDFLAWCEGKTGFPIVDAGMRQLNTTGFMHNRVRMIVASFLTKDLHINWLQGEKYFAQNLVDYDPAVNNGNWQWVASTGCDAQPYFRIFNPWLQQKKFDVDCIYIKKWVPELKNIPPKELHTLFKKPLNLKNYPNPMVDHQKESAKAKEYYKKAAQDG